MFLSRSRTVWTTLALSIVAALAVPAPAAGQNKNDKKSVVMTPVGASEVNYFDHGALTSEVHIPSSSKFWRTGEGSGSTSAPKTCGIWSAEEPAPGGDPDGDGPLPAPMIHVERPSLNWVFTELDPVEYEALWDERIADAMTDPYSSAVLTALLGAGKPLADATRRFAVSCQSPDGTETRDLSTIDVSVTDSFWGIYEAGDDLLNDIQLPEYHVAVPDQARAYGGLVVNMPTWWQIDTIAWQPVYSDVEHHRGWDIQIAMFPSTLEFAVDPEDGDPVTIACDPGPDAHHDGAVTPARPDDLPRYVTHGQLPDRPCTWVPHSIDRVNVRATITYHVVLNVSSYTTPLPPYRWSSQLLTLDTGELRSVNITPEP